MTDDDTEQRSITDYPSTGSHSSTSEPKQSEGQPPPPSDPNLLLTWLQEDASSPEEVVEQLPELVKRVRNGGYEAWKASECINDILVSVSPPIDCPELIAILDDEHVDTLAVIGHLLRIYPRDIARLEPSIDFDFLESDELSHTERMEVYRTLSCLPPDEEIYSELRSTAKMFDGVVVLDERYPVGGFFRTYASRCLISYLHNPQQALQNCAHRAIRDHPWAAVRVVANDLEYADAELLDHLIDVLDGRVISHDFYHGQIIAMLCEGFTQTISSETEQEVRTLIQVLLDTGVSPTHWETIVPQLIDWLDREDSSRADSAVLAAVLEATRQQDIDQELIDEIAEKLVTGNPEPWTEPILVVAETHPKKLVKHIDDLVTVARASDGAVRTNICKALGTLGKAEQNNVLEGVEPLVVDLERVNSAQELADVGSILESLNVYPPPPQLRDLYGSTDEQIDKKAKEIAASLRRQFQRKTPELVPGEVDTLQTLSEEYSLVRRTGATTWDSPSLTAPRRSIITAIAQIAADSSVNHSGQSEALSSTLDELLDISHEEFAEANESIQFVVPSYDSEWIEFAVLGAALAQIVDPDIQVVLHTPASGGWGTKKDIKEALRQYAISPSDNPSNVIPLLDLVPTARITDGEVTVEAGGTTITDDPPHLTLIRDIDPLIEAPADIILYNYLPGIDATNAAQLQQWRGTISGSSVSDNTGRDEAVSADGYGEIADKASLTNLIEIDEVEPRDSESGHPDDPVHVEIYSIFTSQQAADRRQHVGPPTDLPVPSLVSQDAERASASSQTGKESSGDVHPEAVALTEDVSRVELHAVRSDGEIGELLSNVDEYSNRVSDPEMGRALRGFKYTIGSLPIPVDLHDTWVQNQIDQGNKWVPHRIHSRRNSIQALADEAGFDAELLDEAVITIDTLLDRLGEMNPVAEELMTVLDDAAAGGKRVGILCAKKTYKDMLDIYLADRASEWILGDNLLLLDEDSIRELRPGEVDWIIAFDPLPPQTAIYYHHPAVEKTVVLGHADGTLESRVHGVEYKRRPFLPRRVDAELPDLEVTTHGSTMGVSEDDKSLTDNLYRTYLAVAAQSRTDDGSQSGSTGQLARYRVEFAEGREKTMWNVHPMIVQSEEHLVSTGNYVLRSLSRISTGDEMVLIDSDTRRALWEEFLREDWEESDEAEEAEEAFMDAVELWYEAVSTGLAAHSATSDLGEGIWDFSREIDPEVSVETETVVDWARSVYRAESPSDLVFRSDLRIGPQHADGVEAVAEAYGCDRMTNNWRQVFTRIKSIRATHRQRGSVFWEWLVDRACDGSLFDQPGVSHVTVTRCKSIE